MQKLITCQNAATSAYEWQSKWPGGMDVIQFDHKAASCCQAMLRRTSHCSTSFLTGRDTAYMKSPELVTVSSSSLFKLELRYTVPLNKPLRLLPLSAAYFLQPQFFLLQGCIKSLTLYNTASL